jgi:hypothetical protein
MQRTASRLGSKRLEVNVPFKLDAGGCRADFSVGRAASPGIQFIAGLDSDII